VLLHLCQDEQVSREIQREKLMLNQMQIPAEVFPVLNSDLVVDHLVKQYCASSHWVTFVICWWFCLVSSVQLIEGSSQMLAILWKVL
jgi:hypothetical protein